MVTPWQASVFIHSWSSRCLCDIYNDIGSHATIDVHMVNKICSSLLMFFYHELESLNFVHGGGTDPIIGGKF